MKHPLISIVVPVYNASRWLDNCVESILRQSLEDYELLLIDDGSKDDSLQICKSYASRDQRIHVIHKDNGGVSSARNAGLDNARGSWIVFVDSDDTVEEHYLKGLHDAIAEIPSGKVALGVGGFQLVYAQTEEWIKNSAFSDQSYQKQEVARGFLDNELYRRGYPFSKIYYRESIEQFNLRFEEKISYCEDLTFMLDYLCHADQLVFTSRCDYIYRRSISGLSASYSCFEAEYHLLGLLKQRTFSLIGKQCNDKNWISFYSTLAVRALSCLYRPKFKLPRVDRLLALKRFTEEHGELLSQTTHPKLRLLAQRRYCLFDTRMATLYYLRYSILKRPWQIWRNFKNRPHRSK